MTKNLTVGSPASLILLFAAPLFIGNLFQQLYGTVDALIVGRTIDVNALAAVGCTGSIQFLILGFIIGFTQGSSIITAQRFGAGDEAGVRRSFAVTIVLSAGLAVLLTTIGIISARPLLRILRTPPEIIEGAYAYISVIYAGIISAVLFNLCANIMRAVGDSRTPLIFLVLACILNIILDFVFILVFHTGVRGAGFATVIAQLLSGLLCIPVIRNRLPILKITAHDFRAWSQDSIVHLRIAIPAGFQMSIIAIGTVTVQFALNGLGTIAVAAFTAGQRIDQFATMPLASFGAAMVTYSAQNYGARKIDRIRKGVLHCCCISCSFAVVMGILYFVAGNHFAAFFIGPSEYEAIRFTHTYLRINGSFYIFLACLFIFRQTLQGLGNSIIPTIAGIAELLMRIFAAIILAHYFGFSGICFSGPLAYIGACIPLVWAMTLTLRRLSRKNIP
ncbi:MAG: MATE family efflux transporter [Treponema sp.]|jgi:putative MATE family efflux protein|nr:MATE family efflux transporter [Treponema sp.]